MGQADSRLSISEPWSSPTDAANDDFRPYDKDQDPWPWLIERLKGINMPFAVFAAQERLKGTCVYAFCEMVVARFERLEELQARGLC